MSEPANLPDLPDLGSWEPTPGAAPRVSAPNPEMIAPLPPPRADDPLARIAFQPPRPATIHDILRDQKSRGPVEPHPRLKLGEIRHSYGVSMKTILREIGISSQTYSYIERGISNPNFATICKLARFFQMTVDELFPDLIERLAPGYEEAVARGKEQLPPAAPTEVHHPEPGDGYNLVPGARVMPHDEPMDEEEVDFAPPPPPSEFLRTMVDEFDAVESSPLATNEEPK